MKKKQYIDKEYVAILEKALATEHLGMKIVDTVLIAITTLGIMGVVLAAPNALQLLKPILRKREYSSRQIRSALDHLRKQKSLHYIKENNGEILVRITNRGQSRIKAFVIDSIRISKPKKWDGKWCLVMFDIPVRFTKAREAFRWKLKQIGFTQLQRSVWVFPYKCEDELLFVADFFGVGKYIEIVTAESILNDQKLRKHFGVI